METPFAYSSSAYIRGFSQNTQRCLITRKGVDATANAALRAACYYKKKTGSDTYVREQKVASVDFPWKLENYSVFEKKLRKWD